MRSNGLCSMHLLRYSIIKRQMSSISSRRRVVVTGCGVVSPIGCTLQTAWNNLLNGACGITQLKDKSYETLPCKIAAKISEDDLQLEKYFAKSDLRAISPATAFALIAGK